MKDLTVMTTTKRRGRILSEMHETARGLHAAGLIDKRRMCELDALCYLDVEEMPPQKIKAPSEATYISQAVLPLA